VSGPSDVPEPPRDDPSLQRKEVLVADGTAARLVLLELFDRLGCRTRSVVDAEALTEDLAAGKPLDLLILSLRLVRTEPSLALAAFRDAGITAGIILAGDASADRPAGVRSIGERALVAEGAQLSELVFVATELLFAHDELRRYTRVFGGFAVLYMSSGDSKWCKGEIFNLSREGAFVETSSPLPVGAKVRLQFRLPLAKETIELRAEVARVNPPSSKGAPPGMGLKFTHLTHRDEDSLTRFLTHKRAL
jgi:uncharacterized protein (TIGR02266 family)